LVTDKAETASGSKPLHLVQVNKFSAKMKNLTFVKGEFFNIFEGILYPKLMFLSLINDESYKNLSELDEIV
jgi:hypothetical protein